MPIKLPNLDNKSFDDLMKEMIASIPKYTKEWTNFNPSDPGITILELLAWISEAMIYRANRIPKQSYINFLRFIAGTGDIYRKDYDINTDLTDTTDSYHKAILSYIKNIVGGGETADIPSMKAAAQNYLNSGYRAITEKDFKKLAIEASPDIRRVEISSEKNKFFPEYNNIVIIPITEYETIGNIAAICDAVRDYLRPRLLVGTVIKVRPAEYTSIKLKVTLFSESFAKIKPKPGIETSVKYSSGDEAVKDIIRKTDVDWLEDAVAKAIFTYLDGIIGGPDGKGWPYKRSLMIYELFHIVEKIDQVNHVESIVKDEETKSFDAIEVTELIRLDSLEVTVKETKDI